jgi:hypothetical protein
MRDQPDQNAAPTTGVAIERPAHAMTLNGATRRSLPLLAVFIVACASHPRPPQQRQLAQAVAAPSRLEPRESMPLAARAVLKSRMVDHARDMRELMSAIMILDYPAIHGEALAIADNSNLSRPLTADATELNSQLPESFFLYQDQVRRDARTLAAAADRLNPFDTATSYGRLSESCVRCHAVYRGGR